MIISFNLEMNFVDNHIYHKFSGSKVLYLVLYVNDILLVNNKYSLNQCPKNDIKITKMH